jgi:cytochrome bd-type quinol oxidase subunit 2
MRILTMSYDRSTMRDTDHERNESDRHVVRAVAAVLALVAVSLAVASVLHLTGHVVGRAKPFDSDNAGVAEAIIAAVLASGSILMLRNARRARAIGLTVTAFAIAGFIVGLITTTQGGHLPDIAYHLTILPLLVGSLVVLIRATGSQARTDSRPGRDAGPLRNRPGWMRPGGSRRDGGTSS